MSHDLHHHDAADASLGHARQHVSYKALGVAVVLTLGFAAAEFFAALISQSMALMADAGHMITDSTALFLALVAQWIARKPPSETSSYGHGRIEALAAFVNSIAMLGLAVWILMESVDRFGSPHPISGDTVIVVAVLGLIVNVLVAWVLSRDQDSLNTKAALVHVLGDLLGSIAALASGLVIHFTGWTPIDPILSIFVCLLILKSTWSLLRSSYRILMEHVPESVDFRQVAEDMRAITPVKRVHNLHIWETSPGHITLTAHLTVGELQSWPGALIALQTMLREKHGIDHATLQPELTESI